MATLAVTGSTGTIGGLVARELAGSGVATRLIVRDTTRAPDLPQADVVQATYGDRDASLRALAGVEVLFMVSAGESSDRRAEHRRFIDASVAAGVTHLVYLSFSGASETARFTLARDHAVTEDHIRASGIDYTFLRDNFYTEMFPLMAGEDGVIRGPARDGRVAAVSQRDVGAVAARVLAEPASHRNATYELTGPEALTLDEIAQALTDETGKPYRFYDETLDEARASRAPYGAPDWQVEAWISTYTAIADGELDAVSDDVPRLLGRPGRGFHDVFAGR
ncbi:MAG: nucleoside-diphosphate sugar epimerase [Nocardioidaceae bacterium]|nr:nucleoside-diphosphate sugar epimerase [Nocardioidaceae bacterium]